MIPPLTPSPFSAVYNIPFVKTLSSKLLEKFFSECETSKKIFVWFVLDGVIPSSAAGKEMVKRHLDLGSSTGTTEI